MREAQEPPGSDSVVPQCSSAAPPPHLQPQPHSYRHRYHSRRHVKSTPAMLFPTHLRQRRDMSGKRCVLQENQAVEFENGCPPAMTPVIKEVVALWYPMIESVCAHEITIDSCMHKGMGSAAVRTMSDATATGLCRRRHRSSRRTRAANKAGATFARVIP